MEKEFIPYEQALALKELGFNEPCFARYEYIRNELQFPFWNPKNHNQKTGNGINYQFISAPLYQQAFRWFREKYDITSFIQRFEGDVFDYEINSYIFEEETDFGDGYFDTYEEAELACLKKLIEIIKENKL
jgi:hypothetical protein